MEGTGTGRVKVFARVLVVSFRAFIQQKEKQFLSFFFFSLLHSSAHRPLHHPLANSLLNRENMTDNDGMCLHQSICRSPTFSPLLCRPAHLFIQL